VPVPHSFKGTVVQDYEQEWIQNSFRDFLAHFIFALFIFACRFIKRKDTETVLSIQERHFCVNSWFCRFLMMSNMCISFVALLFSNSHLLFSDIILKTMGVTGFQEL
jgi:hypothetical protein